MAAFGPVHITCCQARVGKRLREAQVVGRVRPCAATCSERRPMPVFREADGNRAIGHGEPDTKSKPVADLVANFKPDPVGSSDHIAPDAEPEPEPHPGDGPDRVPDPSKLPVYLGRRVRILARALVVPSSLLEPSPGSGPDAWLTLSRDCVARSPTQHGLRRPK